MKSFVLSTVTSLVLISGCGKSPDIPHEIDPVFQQYLTQFKSDADKNNVGYGDVDSVTVVKFQDLTTNTVDGVREYELGVCHFHSETKNKKTVSYKEIDIDPAFNNSSETFKEKVFLHQVGECFYHMNPNFGSSEIMKELLSDVPRVELETDKIQFFADAKLNQANWVSTEDL
jgi:hypothetical protein